MWQALLWKLAFFAISTVFSISKDFLTTAFEEVQKANELRHEGGSKLTGSEKYEYVFEALVVYAENYNWGDKTDSITNMVIELAVGYLKSNK